MSNRRLRPRLPVHLSTRSGFWRVGANPDVAINPEHSSPHDVLNIKIGDDRFHYVEALTGSRHSVGAWLGISIPSSPDRAYSASPRRSRFRSEFRFFSAMRRSFAARVGLVALRFFGTWSACSMRRASRSSAA